jgi:hypothetical protein
LLEISLPYLKSHRIFNNTSIRDPDSPVSGVGGELLVIDAERIAHAVEEPGDGIGADGDAEIAEGHRHFRGGATGPLQAGDRVASGSWTFTVKSIS